MKPAEGTRKRWHLGAAIVPMCVWLALPAAAQTTVPAPGPTAGAPALPAGAQTTLPPTGSTTGSAVLPTADQPVSVSSSGGTLTDAIRQLMHAVQADFTIDSALGDATVSVHLTAVRFQVALDTVLKVSSIPVTYRVEKGVYRFGPKPDSPLPPDENENASPPTGPELRQTTIKLKNISATTAKETVDEDPDYRDYRLQYQGSPTGGFSRAGSATGRSDYSGYGFSNGRYFSYSFSTVNPGAAGTPTTQAESAGTWLSLLNGNLHLGVTPSHR